VQVAAVAPVNPPPPPPVAAAPVAAAPAGTRSATQERDTARNLLEKGRVAAAIAAGERAVALDPSDGDAWLILGAAYQEQGRAGEARRCFSSCVKVARKGAVSECGALLR
jgi:Flp pilus assembly protein TadD